MTRSGRKIRRGHGKASGMYRLRIEVERIFQGEGPEGGIPLSMLPLRDHLAQAAKRFPGSRAIAPLFSIAMTGAVYRYCAALAYLERGGKTAYGGECLVSLAAGALAFHAARRMAADRR